MLFSQNKQGDEKSPKKQSVLGFLFRPRFGDDVSPIANNLRMFIRLIMYLLASQNLFPKNHPAYLDENVSISLRDLLSISYGRLSFTKEGLPQVLLFFAVCGCFVCSFLFAILFVLSMIVGSAHAASMFTAPGDTGTGTSCDLAQNWLNYLFLGKNVNADTSCGAGVMAPNGQGIQNALKGGLALYSSAILVFAGFILIYHLASMIAETAYSGVAMGKRANQIWAPIRLVVAIGLLIPIGTGGGGGSGLNTAQFIAIQMARWGSGLASYVWSGFLTELGGQMGSMDLVVPPPPYMESLVKQVVMLETCKATYNQVMTYMFTQANLSSEISKYTINPPKLVEVTCPDGPCGYYASYSNTANLDDITPTVDYVNCGSLQFPPAPTAADGQDSKVRASSLAMYKASVDVLKELIADSDVVKVAQGGPSSLPAPYSDGVSPVLKSSDINDGINKLVKSYSAKMSTAMSKAISGGGSDSSLAKNINTLSGEWSKQGWVMAGAWFNTIARAQGNLYDQAQMVNDVKFSPPTLDFGHSSWYGVGKPLKSTSEIVTAALKTVSGYIASAAGDTPANLAASGTDAATNPSMWGLASAMLTGLDKLGKMMGLWPENGGLAISFGSKANPMAEIVSAGYKYIAYGFNLVIIAGSGMAVAAIAGGIAGATLSAATGPFVLFGAGGGALVGMGLAKLAGSLLGFVMTVASAFIGMGIMLAFYVPLLPFIKFFFNVLTWILTVFEAVVSAPLFALAHLTPYGDGLPGSMAQKGYFFLFSIFLRPVLLVFGLMAGFLIFFIAVHFLNASFLVATAGVGATSGGLSVLSKIVYSIMYGFLAYICANTCFKAISFFAEHGLSWMSAAGSSAPGMGSQGHMGQFMTVAMGYTGSKMADAVGGGTRGIGESLNDGMGRISANKKEKANTKAHADEIEDNKKFMTGLFSGKGGNQQGNMAGGNMSAGGGGGGGAGGASGQGSGSGAAVAGPKNNASQMPQVGGNKEPENNPLLTGGGSGNNMNAPTVPDRALGRDAGFNDEQMMKLEKLRLDQQDKDHSGPQGG